MSEVIAFCERHSLTSMLNLLRNCGQMTPVRELFAVKLLEELVANDPEKLSALGQIRSRINPVEMSARFRATIKEREAKILAAMNEKKDLASEIDRLQEALEQKKKASPAVPRKPRPAVIPTPPAANPEPQETQVFCDEYTQPVNIDQAATLVGKDDDDTQPGDCDQAAALRLVGR